MKAIKLTTHRSRIFQNIVVKLLFCSSLFLSGFSSAQDGTDATVIEIEIDRDSDQLSDLLTGTPNPNPDVASLLDTAMIVTSVASTPTLVRCHANDDNGELAGRIRMLVPGAGLRFFLASDIIKERGFVGSVICSAPALVVGTEIMLGVVTSDIEVQQDYRASGTTMLFPVTAMR